MKLKQLSADFLVQELNQVVPAADGPYAYYLLEKSGWTTPDAIGLIRRRWSIEAARISYGGLKDRHAETKQYFTIRSGPRRGLDCGPVRVRYLGQIGHAYDSTAITANRFRVTLRDLADREVERMVQSAEEVRTAGLPNYFDDQRFGSVGRDGRFIGKELVLGNFEEALRLALAAEYEFDGPRQKAEKRVLTAEWGRWPECLRRLPPGHARSLVQYLSDHPDDFRGAVARLRPELQGLYLSAYQSELWNRMLATWLRERFRADELTEIRLKRGRLPVPRRNEADWAAMQLPLPSARAEVPPESVAGRLMQRVLAEEGLTADRMKVPGLRKPFFSRGERSARIDAAELSWTPADDEMHPGRRKLTLAFELPRGSYATILVKRLQSAVAPA